MKRFLHFAIFFTSMIMLFGCGRKINCPDFNSEVLQWIPYEKNDTIELHNLANDSVLMLPVRSIIATHTTHYITNLKCGECDDNIMINAEMSSIQFFANIYLNKNQITSQFYMIHGSNFDDDENHMSEESNFTFEGNGYNNVRIFTNNITTAPFNKLIIAKGFGIIGLIDRDGNTWKMKNPALRNSRMTDIEIVETSCE